MPNSRNGAAGRTPNLMEESSRPATLEDLKLLLRSLNEHGVDYRSSEVTRWLRTATNGPR